MVVNFCYHVTHHYLRSLIIKKLVKIFMDHTLEAFTDTDKIIKQPSTYRLNTELAVLQKQLGLRGVRSLGSGWD